MPLIQDIFTQHGGIYLKKYGKKMPSLHKKALYAIMNCRTKHLGGEMYYCSNCREYHYSYHSCGNRHCAVCQNNDAGDWIAKQKKKMLPLNYFLATFTMPEALRNLCRKNQKLFYNILFKASSDAIKVLAKDDKYLGAEIGMIGILHTWSRALVFHPHVHYLIPGGGIPLKGNGKHVRFSDADFLMHVKPLSIIFRAKFREALKDKAVELFNQVPHSVWKQDWVVHIKPVSDGEQAVEYMGRYLFRVAISNNRILKLENGKVTFRYIDSKTGKTKIVTLNALEFIRRFLQNVLPHNFMKLRYYGFFAAASKRKLHKLREGLYLDPNPENNQEDDQWQPKVFRCPICGSPLQWVEKLESTMPRGFRDHVP